MSELPLNYQRMLRAQQPPEVFRDRQHEHYHKQQASKIDTSAKRLARSSGYDYVVCPCGERFNA